MNDLSNQREARRLRIYISEGDRWRGKPLDAALLDLMRQHHMAGATVFRGLAGFGAHSHLSSTSIETLSFNLPIVIELVDTPEKIAAILEIIYPTSARGCNRRDHRQSPVDDLLYARLIVRGYWPGPAN